MKVCGKEILIQGKLVRIARLDADTYEFLEDPEGMLDALRKSDVRADLFTFMQRLPETSTKYHYPMEWDNLAALPISTFDQWWTEQIDAKTRNMVRKAEKKGVEVREVPFDDALVDGIWTIYNECPVRQGKPFAHYGKDIETVRKEAGTYLERSIFIGAFLGDSLIGFVKLLFDETRTQAGLLHIVSMIQHRDKAPTNALVAQAVRAGAARGIPYLVYSRFSDGKKRRDSLIEFKEHNGFQRVNLPRYYVPLTLIGRTALSLGLHKRVADRVPEPVLVKLRELRNAWHNRKLRSKAEASG
jgi:hypothetical protein